MNLPASFNSPEGASQARALYGDIGDFIANLPPHLEHEESTIEQLEPLPVFSPLEEKHAAIIRKGLVPLRAFGSTTETQRYAHIDFVILKSEETHAIDALTSAALLNFFGKTVPQSAVSKTAYFTAIEVLHEKLERLKDQREEARQKGELAPVQTTTEAASRLGQFCVSLAASWEIEHSPQSRRGSGFRRVIESVPFEFVVPLRACIGYALHTIYPPKP